MTKYRPFLLMAISAGALAACSTNPVGGIFNRDQDVSADVAVAEETPAEVDDGRIPVLALEAALEPDPRYASVPVSIPPAFANAEWSQPGGEADHVMHHLSGPESYSLAWRAKIGVGGTMRAPLTSPPVIANRRVFTMDASAVVKSFDTEDGAERWSTTVTPEISGPTKRRFGLIGGGKTKPEEVGFGGGVAYEGGRIFAATGFGTAVGLSADSGEVLWQVNLPAPVRNPPTAVDGRVYVLTTANQIIALDQNTGETAWVYESFEESARFLSTGSVAVDADTVIAPFSSGEVVALDAVTGRLMWSATVARSSRLNGLSNLNDIAGSPVVDRGGVFAVSHSGQLSAIDGRTGRVAWEAPIAGLNMPWVSGDFLFVVSVDGKLVCLNRGDGGVVWRIDLPGFANMKKQKDPISWTGPILVGERLLVTSSGGTMLQIDPQDGEVMQTYSLDGATTVPPVVADGTVFIVNNDARLEAWR